jgi:hypothetical protein
MQQQPEKHLEGHRQHLVDQRLEKLGHGEHVGAEEGMTANAVCYHQNCPVCGRNLRIRVTLLGRLVYCQHCGGGFVASDAKSLAPGPVPPSHPARVDELLERAAVMLGRQGG